jgi:hypothetical protein
MCVKGLKYHNYIITPCKYNNGKTIIDVCESVKKSKSTVLPPASTAMVKAVIDVCKMIFLIIHYFPWRVQQW